MFDLVLLDMNFNASINTGNEGLYWLRRIKEIILGISVIMITAYGDIDLAVRSLIEGASDFIVKPWHNEKLVSTIHLAQIRKEKHTKVKKENCIVCKEHFEIEEMEADHITPWHDGVKQALKIAKCYAKKITEGNQENRPLKRAKKGS